MLVFISGEYHRLVKELELERTVFFTQYMRIDSERFHELANLLRPEIAKLHTNWRKPISVEERLAVTLRQVF